MTPVDAHGGIAWQKLDTGETFASSGWDCCFLSRGRRMLNIIRNEIFLYDMCGSSLWWWLT